MRYLGIDFGTRKVGIALSDERGTMGFPHSIIPNTPALLGEVVTLIKKEGVEAVVIVKSENFAGEENPVATQARAFGDQIAEEVNVPVYYESETLTSAEARRQHEPEAKSRAPRDTRDIDDSAAALILTSYLSRTHG